MQEGHMYCSLMSQKQIKSDVLTRVRKMRLFRKNRGKKKKAKPNKGREKVLSPVRLTFFHGVWKVQDHTESDFNMHTFFNRHRKRQRSGQSVRSTTKSLRALQVTGSSNILSWCVKMFRIIQRVF